MVRKSLQLGYCASSDGSFCSFSADECPDEFRSSREMQGSPDRAHGGVCLLQESIRDKRLGKCCNTSDKCSPNAASCNDSSNCYNPSPINDDSCLVSNTKFGACGTRCSWSPDSCAQEEDWSFPKNDCSCDKVQVGGCLKDGQVFCAVSANACDDLSMWLTPLEVVANTDTNCFLCREPRSDSGSNESGSGSNESGSGANNDLSSANNSSGRGGLGDGAIISITVTCGVALCVAIIAFATVTLKRRRYGNKTLSPPVQVTSGSGDADDDISVLDDREQPRM